ncbi:hypothetical protein DFH09DRAFT_1090937 [Mycena vulgaris]|nr:hypothetical protein DFH09DRAFT_1090937 [Mycena vulgaris]
MSDSELYSRLLFPKKQGYPLFNPQPYTSLLEPARRTGTKIGDVGVVTMHGAFNPIFNLCLEGNDPANRLGVPLGFEKVVLGPSDIEELVPCHHPGSDISSKTINKRRLGVSAGISNNVFLPLAGGAVVEVSTNAKQTGLLLLPDGSTAWDLKPLQRFREQAFKHGESWYEFVNGVLGRTIGNGDLYLVTGFTKSTSWHVAVVNNDSGDRELSLKLKAAQIGNAGASCAWEWENVTSSANSGPRRLPGEESWKENQTVFLRGFKVALRSMPRRRSPKVLSIFSAKWSDMVSKLAASVPFSQPRPRPSLGNNSQSPPSTMGNGGGPANNQQSLNSVSSVSVGITCSLPPAKVAVTHDNEWASLLDEEEEEIPEYDELIARIPNRFNISVTPGIPGTLSTGA